jgi:hypothetical protein
MSRNRSYVTAKVGRGYFFTTEVTPIMKLVVGGFVSYAVFPTFTLTVVVLIVSFFIWMFVMEARPIKVDPVVYTDNLVNRLSKLDINILLENTEAVKLLLEKELTNRCDRISTQTVYDALERSYYYALSTKNEELIKMIRPYAIVIFSEELAEHLLNEKNTINLKERLRTKLEEINKNEEEERRALILKYPFLQNVE